MSSDPSGLNEAERNEIKAREWAKSHPSPKVEEARSSASKGGMGITWGAEHRTGYCSTCGTALVQDPKVPEHDIIDHVEGTVLVRGRTDHNFCPFCADYRLGVLVVRQASVDPPVPLTGCMRPSCVARYLKQALTFYLIVSYHSRRVAYAESHKGKKILERYRTGNPAPATLWAAIHANIKLGCPVCRRYNVDPLLFGAKPR